MSFEVSGTKLFVSVSMKVSFSGLTVCDLVNELLGSTLKLTSDLIKGNILPSGKSPTLSLFTHGSILRVRG